MHSSPFDSLKFTNITYNMPVILLERLQLTFVEKFYSKLIKCSTFEIPNLTSVAFLELPYWSSVLQCNLTHQGFLFCSQGVLSDLPLPLYILFFTLLIKNPATTLHWAWSYEIVICMAKVWKRNDNMLSFMQSVYDP